MSGFCPTGCSVNHGEDVRVALGEEGQQCPREYHGNNGVLEWEGEEGRGNMVVDFAVWQGRHWWEPLSGIGRHAVPDKMGRNDVMEREDDFWREMTKGQ